MIFSVPCPQFIVFIERTF